MRVLNLHMFSRQFDHWLKMKGRLYLIKILLHMEGIMILLLSTYFYFQLGFNWILFAALFFVPDLSALGYLKNNEFGSIVYNLFHTYSIPIVLLIFGLLINCHIYLIIGLIWVAHIGMDRMLGYGLKYPTKFKNTHLNRIS